MTTRAIVWSPAGTGPFPTLLFSPGYGQKPAAYSTLLRDWARHGFLVIAIQHPDFPDPDNVELYDAELVIARQLSKVLTQVLHEQTGQSTPFARIDPTRVGVIGHSIGGGAAAQVCAWDTRFRAGMNLDGTIFGPVIHTGMTQPFFLVRQRVDVRPNDPPHFYENRDQANLHEDSVFSHSPTMYWLTVEGLDHMAFTDAALAPGVGARVQSAVGLRQSAEETQAMTTRYVLDFFGHYLNGDPRPGSFNASPFARTSLRRKPAG